MSVVWIALNFSINSSDADFLTTSLCTTSLCFYKSIWTVVNSSLCACLLYLLFPICSVKKAKSDVAAKLDASTLATFFNQI